MIAGVVDNPVVGEHYALRAARGRAQRVHVAFRPTAPRRVGQQALAIPEAVAADAHSGQVFLKRSAAPARGARLVLRHEVRRKVPVAVNIERDVVLARVAPVFVERLLRRGGRLRSCLRRGFSGLRRGDVRAHAAAEQRAQHTQREQKTCKPKTFSHCAPRFPNMFI